LLVEVAEAVHPLVRITAAAAAQAGYYQPPQLYQQE
jgi:hypothetical protein